MNIILLMKIKVKYIVLIHLKIVLLKLVLEIYLNITILKKYVQLKANGLNILIMPINMHFLDLQL